MRIDNAQVNAATNPELIKAASYSMVGSSEDRLVVFQSEQR